MVSSHAPIETGYVNDTVSDSNATGPSPSGKGMSFVEAGLNDIQDIAKKGMAAAADVASKLGFPSLSTEQPQLLAGATDGRQWPAGATDGRLAPSRGAEQPLPPVSKDDPAHDPKRQPSDGIPKDDPAHDPKRQPPDGIPKDDPAHDPKRQPSDGIPDHNLKGPDKPPVDSPAPPRHDLGVGVPAKDPPVDWVPTRPEWTPPPRKPEPIESSR